MTPEGFVKAAIKKELDAYPDHYREMPVPGGFGKSGLDFTVCFCGRFVAIEAKAPGNKPTARQEKTMRDIKRANGIVICIDSVNAARTTLRTLLKELYGTRNANEAAGDREAA